MLDLEHLENVTEEEKANLVAAYEEFMSLPSDFFKRNHLKRNAVDFMILYNYKFPDDVNSLSEQQLRKYRY